jgi:uncharacterized protein YegL
MMSFGRTRPRGPSVAVVYATVDGELELLGDRSPDQPGPGRPLRWDEKLMTRYRARYEVDLRHHHRVVALQSSPLPAMGDTNHFEAVFDVGFRVTDPIEVIRSGVTDAVPLVYNYLINAGRTITRGFDIRQTADAENALNAWFRQERAVDGGVTIFSCQARLRPDEAARNLLATAGQANLHEAAKSAAFAVDVQDQIRAAQLAGMQQAAELARNATAQQADLARRAEERAANAGRGNSVLDLVRSHLEQHPTETLEAIKIAAQVEQARIDRSDQLDANLMNLFKFMAEQGLMRPADFVQFQNEVLKRVQGIGTTATRPLAGWTDELPTIEATIAPAATSRSDSGLVPVYLVIDGSSVMAEHIDLLNTTLRQLYATLAQERDVARAISLCVLGYGDRVQVLADMATVVPGIHPGYLFAGGQPQYGAVFASLLERIPRDTQTLKQRHDRVRRPQVIFLSADRPADPDAWADIRARLLLDQFHPEILACGVGSVSAADIANVATRQELAFMSVEPDLRAGIERFAAFMQAHILNYGRALLSGAPQMIEEPPGFRLAAQ